MKKEAITTFPFAGDGALSPLTNRSRPLRGLDRDYERRLNFFPSGNHVFIEEPDVDDKQKQFYPTFAGEFNVTGIDNPKAKGYVIITNDGRRIVVKNKAIPEVLKKLKEEGISWRYMTALVADSDSFVKEAQASNRFVPIVSGILASCFKIESESYKFNVKEIGSCFYVKKNYLITCAHVVSRKHEKDLSNIAVFLVDGERRLFCQIVDVDYDLDLALLYCDAVKHHPIQTKSINEVEVGEEIICVGSPYGYDNNVTTGVLSSKDRYIKNENDPYFFMDLSVYPGSSGGPIVDSRDSKAFGVAAMIVESVANYGLNAGIPIDVCLRRFEKALKMEV